MPLCLPSTDLSLYLRPVALDSGDLVRSSRWFSYDRRGTNKHAQQKLKVLLWATVPGPLTGFCAVYIGILQQGLLRFAALVGGFLWAVVAMGPFFDSARVRSMRHWVYGHGM